MYSDFLMKIPGPTKNKPYWLTTEGDGTWILGTALGLTWLATWQRMTPSAKEAEMSSGREMRNLDSIPIRNWLMCASALADFSTSARRVLATIKLLLWWPRMRPFFNACFWMMPVGDLWGMEVVEAARVPLLIKLEFFALLCKSGCEPRPATERAGLGPCFDWKHTLT